MMTSLFPSDLSLGQLHGVLLGSVGPRPIAFASTMNENGIPNLAPFSYFNVFSANPPILIFSPARRGRNNTTKHSYENAKKHAEVVINIVDYSIVQQMSLASTDYPEGVDEFVKSGLTAIDSDIVAPPRVKESPVQYECKVNDIVELGQDGGAGNLIICEVVKMHIRTDLIDDNYRIDQTRIDTVGRMGANYYTRASGDALFEVAKPLSTMGIGVDNIPKEFRNSPILTGNDLGQLGNIEQLPNETEVNDYKLIELSEIFVKYEDEPHELEIKLHEHAHELLANGRVSEAWMTLMSFNN